MKQVSCICTNVKFCFSFSGNPDILICGNCREMFTDIHELLEHKKTYCKLRFTCKCDANKSSKFLALILLENIEYKKHIAACLILSYN